jgi:large subunit ribosomal protein L17
MRHRRKVPKLGRKAQHRRSMLRNMATELLDHGSIRTTLPKAKAVRSYTERLITTARKDTLAARRQILRKIKNEGVVHKLFNTLAPRYAERPGGYTRVLRLGIRHGDKAQMALVQLVEEGDSLQPKHGKRRKPRADDPNAPLEVKRAALKLDAQEAGPEAAEPEEELESEEESPEETSEDS